MRHGAKVPVGHIPDWRDGTPFDVNTDNHAVARRTGNRWALIARRLRSFGPVAKLVDATGSWCQVLG